MGGGDRGAVVAVAVAFRRTKKAIVGQGETEFPRVKDHLHPFHPPVFSLFMLLK